MSQDAEAYPGKRFCQVVAVKKEALEEYKKIHADVWPTVLETLRKSNIVDYSINLLPSPPVALTDGPSSELAGLLIATFKYIGSDWESDSKIAASDPETCRWWAITDGMQHSLIPGATGSKDGPWWYQCEEVFRHEK
ncbi:rhamnose mutarotase [Ceratobasidium sp. AG-I]|nr:rhamnose mutarotase [Ceratobasidium sp. AG-I]